ncbi:MAG: hypothetical protein ACK42D_01975 [Candidatus Paceibacteria bacterium]
MLKVEKEGGIMQNFWLDVILKIEDDARKNGILPIVEKWTIGPKLFAISMMSMRRIQKPLPPAE